MPRWTDERLDDLAKRVDGKLDDLAEDLTECLHKLEEMGLEWRVREQALRQERKSDIRWLIGTAIAVAAIIVAALGVFIH